MSTRDNFIWKAIQAVCWVIFVGYCVRTEALLFNFVFSLFRPVTTHNLYLGLDLSALYAQHQPLYTDILMGIIALSAGKAYVFFMTTQLFAAINLATPFNDRVATLITRITSCTFFIGLASVIADELVAKLANNGYPMSGVAGFWNDGGVYLTMSAILFVIALIFKKGIALQKENELTI